MGGCIYNDIHGLLNAIWLIVSLSYSDQNFITQDDFKTISSFQVPLIHIIILLWVQILTQLTHLTQIDNLPVPFDEVAVTPTTFCVLVNGSIFVLPVVGSVHLQPSGEHISSCGLKLLGVMVNRDCGCLCCCPGVPGGGLQHVTAGGQYHSVYSEVRC